MVPGRPAPGASDADGTAPVASPEAFPARRWSIRSSDSLVRAILATVSDWVLSARSRRSVILAACAFDCFAVPSMLALRLVSS